MVDVSNGIVGLFSASKNQEPEGVLSVSELIQAVKSVVESTHMDVLVRGEISSFKPWRSGHWYFDLKDANAVLPGVMFKADCARVKFKVEDGLTVLCSGRVSLYAPQSKIQLIVKDMEPVGQGALALAFEQLKKKLEAEGLFDPAKKKRLPLFPKTIGIVTSPQGAALQDMLRVIRQRNPLVNVLLAPCRVQGEGSADEIANAIRQLDGDGSCDVLVVGRGGGSLEDLWSFNEERVARAIFACRTPIVSAVGHETDFTIADFVADLRCATPTHAAQTVVPDLKAIQEELGRQHARLNRCLERQLTTPKLRVDMALERMLNSIKQKRQQAQLKLNQVASHLAALSPLHVLGRGYAVVQSQSSEGDWSAVARVADILPNQLLEIRLSDGSVKARSLGETVS